MRRAAGPVYVIAEVGVNHDGNLDKAFELIDAAAAAGADAVKFQTFSAKQMVAPSASLAVYQRAAVGSFETQLEMLTRLELSEVAFDKLLDHCRSHDIDFLSTPFDLNSLALLLRLGVSTIKVGSGDVTNAPLLRKVGQTRVPVILSTGMSTLSEIETALAVLAAGFEEQATGRFSPLDSYVSDLGQAYLQANVSLLHCTTEYPAPFSEVNLHAIGTLVSAFDLKVGYSDHTDGLEVSVAAVALGASIIEKHITLDRRAPGPDHAASLEPEGFSRLVQAIRNTEAALGVGRKFPTPSEMPNRSVARKSLVALRPIVVGEQFTQENLTVKRAGAGISAADYFAWLGRRATRDYKTDELVDE